MVLTTDWAWSLRKIKFVNYSFDWLRERDREDNHFVIGVGGDKVKRRSVFDFRNAVTTKRVVVLRHLFFYDNLMTIRPSCCAGFC